MCRKCFLLLTAPPGQYDQCALDSSTTLLYSHFFSEDSIVSQQNTAVRRSEVPGGASHPHKVHLLDLEMVLGAFCWYWLISLLKMLWDLTRPFVFPGIFFKFASNTFESFCALDRTTPGSQWAFGERSSGIEWSVTRPWLTLCMEEASQTFSHHLVQKAVATLRHECPSTSSATGPRTWEASVRVWIWIWAQPSGPRLLPSANGSRRWQRSWRRDLVPVVMNHRSALGLWTIIPNKLCKKW